MNAGTHGGIQWVDIGLAHAVRSYGTETRSAGPTEGHQLRYQIDWATTCITQGPYMAAECTRHVQDQDFKAQRNKQ